MCNKFHATFVAKHVNKHRSYKILKPHTTANEYKFYITIFTFNKN